MTKTILFLLTILPTVLFGQETKKVTEENKNDWFKEVYYVLKSDKSIRHGNYQKSGYKEAVLINGFYKNGLKDSIWTEYQWSGKNKKSIGTYSEDKKVGTWEFYDYKGELEQKYDYTKNEIIYFKLDDKEKDKDFRVIKDSDTTKTKLDRPPLYIGGSAMMFEPILKNIQYPPQAKENGVSGKVYITFTIDSNGKTSNHRVTKGIGSGCDEEALRVVKEIPDNWLPGLLSGQAVNVEYVLPISFTLN
jgi:TonB family protein